MNILIMNRKYDSIFGGVEHMSTSLINEMVKRGHQCHLLSLDLPNAKILYDIDSSITWHKISNVNADQKASWKERIHRFFKIRDILKTHNIDVAIGFQDGAFASLATAALGTKTPVIAAERNALSRFQFLKSSSKNIAFVMFMLARTITVQFESYIAEYPTFLQKRIRAIPNPVFPAQKQESNSNSNNRKTLLSVGRFSYQKNYEILIKSFSHLSQTHHEWDLVIVGDGEDKSKLEKLVKDLDLSNRVFFPGYKKDPQDYFTSSDLFCLPSRWEGFPNALAEAMQAGIACVGFEGCSGVSDLIDPQKTGTLAAGNDNEETLTSALKELLENDAMRAKMGQHGQEKMALFEPERIFDRWEELLQSVA